MSILYFILRLFFVSYDTKVDEITNSILCVSDALWIIVLNKIFGWW